MKFATAKEHREFFRKNQFVEFEELLSAYQLKQMQSAIKESLALRMQTPIVDLLDHKPEQLFSHGRDLWRGSPVIKKTITQQRLAEIASELISIRTMRLGYDQLFTTVPQPILKESSLYTSLLKQPHTLEEISSLQGVICGLMLCLTGESSKDSPPDIFCGRAGNGVFFSPKVPINFPLLLEKVNESYLMLVYVQPNSVYVHCANDPLGHSFKSVGYNFGDKLLDKNNPILNR